MVAVTVGDGVYPSAWGGAEGGLRAQIADGEPPSPGARPARGQGRRGGAGAAPAPPSPGPAAVTRPPSRAHSPPYPLPAPPAPGALTWKRFFTHSFFMAGEGAGRAAGRGGDRRGRGGVGGGAGGDPGSMRERAGAGAGGGRSLGAPGAQAGRRLQRRRPEPAPPPPAGTLPSAPSLSCSPASPGAAVTGLPAPPPRICLPGPGHMGKLRHRKGCSGPMKDGASLSLAAQCDCHATPPASRGADLEGQPRISTCSLRKYAHRDPVPDDTQLAVARTLGGP